MINKNNDKLLISFSHSNYLIKPTGTEKCMRELADTFMKNKIHNLQIFSFYNKILANKKTQFIGINYDKKFIGIYKLDQLNQIISNVLIKESLDPIGVHIHHLLNYNVNDLSIILKEINLPITIFLHDYYTICKSISLINSNNSFCGMEFPSEKKCDKCLYYMEAIETNRSIIKFFSELNKNIKSFIVPSKFVYDSWTTLYKDYKSKTFIRPHLEFEGTYVGKTKQKKEKVRIAFVGAQIENKGYEEWKKIVRILSKSGFYEFFYFGTGQEKIANVKNIYVSTVKNGNDAMTTNLRKFDIDCVFLWSLGPETYSYVYYECCSAGCSVITNQNSGNIACGVKLNKNGIISKTIDDVIRLLLDKEYIKAIIQENSQNIEFRPLYYRPNSNLKYIIFEEYKVSLGSYEANKNIKPKKLLTYLYKKKLK